MNDQPQRKSQNQITWKAVNAVGCRNSPTKITYQATGTMYNFAVGVCIVVRVVTTVYAHSHRFALHEDHTYGHIAHHKIRITMSHPQSLRVDVLKLRDEVKRFKDKVSHKDFNI